MEKTTITVQKILDDSEALKKTFQLREEVFVEEQEVDRSEEFDEFEDSSHHFLASNGEGDAVGVARWRRTDHGIKLERFAVRRDVRGQGVGRLLVGAVLDDVIQSADTNERIYLHAQLPAVTLYARFGFQKVGERFLECDIWHYEMERVVGRQST